MAVFRLRDGTLRATQARCPHAGGPLADGQLDLTAIVCPLHARAFAFADGRCAEGETIAVHPARGGRRHRRRDLKAARSEGRGQTPT